MSYYRGDYYRPRGDYYRQGRGDWLGGITGAIGGFLTGGWGGAVIGGAKGALGKKGTASQVAGGLVAQGGGGIMGPVVVNPGAILPGGKPFIERLGAERKYKRIDPTNVKALRRAIRRQGAFMAVVKRTIKGTGMTLKRTGIGGTRKKKR